MLIRRASIALSTLVVAVVVAFTVPTAQLRTIAIIHTCCCPDPSDCHCPPESAAKDRDAQPSMHRCHRSDTAIFGSQLPSFVPAALALVAVAPRVIEAPVPGLPVPHVAPAPARPEAPS